MGFFWKIRFLLRVFARPFRMVFQDIDSWSLVMNTLNVVESVFFAALEKGTPELRAAFLDEACQGDSKLRHCVERMLNAHPKAEGFLHRSPPDSSAARDE